MIRTPSASVAAPRGTNESDSKFRTNANDNFDDGDVHPDEVERATNSFVARSLWLIRCRGFTRYAPLLAHVVIGSDMEFTRPVLNDVDCPLAIKQGRHPS